MEPAQTLDRLFDFLRAGVTPWHAVAQAARWLEELRATSPKGMKTSSSPSKTILGADASETTDVASDGPPWPCWAKAWENKEEPSARGSPDRGAVRVAD